MREVASNAADLATVPDEARWRRTIGDENLIVAHRDGAPQAVAYAEDGLLRAVAARQPDALWALLHEVTSSLSAVEIDVTPNIAALIDPLTLPLPAWTALYARIPNPVAFLNALRPELERRLRESQMSDTTGTLRISTYRTTIVIEYDHGEVAPIVTTTGLPYWPTRDGAAGIAPDHMAELLLGRHGASGLAEKYDDVELDKTAPLMDILFPRLTTDANEVGELAVR